MCAQVPVVIDLTIKDEEPLQRHTEAGLTFPT